MDKEEEWQRKKVDEEDNEIQKKCGRGCNTKLIELKRGDLLEKVLEEVSRKSKMAREESVIEIRAFRSQWRRKVDQKLPMRLR